MTINLYYRGLQGTISPLVSSLTSLKALRLDVNSLHGTLSPYMGNLTNLQYFGVRYAQSLLLVLVNYISSLLSTNRLTGTLPSSFGNLRSINYLLLYNNLFNGSIPSSFCQLTSLSKFYPCDGNGQGCSPNSCVPACINYLSTAHNYGYMPSCTNRTLPFRYLLHP